MALQPPSSVTLRATIERLDAAISEAQDIHSAAEAAARQTISYGIDADAVLADVFLLQIPSTSDTAAKIDELHRARAVAVEMLADALEAERLARDDASCAQLRTVTQLMKTEAEKIDAMYADLAKTIVGLGTLQREAEAILRAQLGINPLPTRLATEIAKSVAGYIAASTGAFPPDHKPVAAMHAAKFASRSLGEAGAL